MRIQPPTGLIFLGIVTAIVLSGCSPQQATTSAGADDHYPITVENCGSEVTFDAEPQRLVMLKSAPVAALHSIGVLDRAVARAGAFPPDYFNDETHDILDDVPELAGEVDASGHLQISADVVISQEPDLLLGAVENLPRDQMSQLGLPLIEEPAFCTTGATGEPTWNTVYDQLEVYGKIFDRQETAEEAVNQLQARVAAVTDKVPANERRRAAVLYPTVGGGVTYAYGTSSMAHPQLETAGFVNVFENVPERVFEVTGEELIARDPEVLVLLYSEGDPEEIEQAIRTMPGADQIAAIRNDQVLTHLINFTEPATPLTVDGLERIVERFH